MTTLNIEGNAESMTRPPFVVIGTGRCGTKSIAEILNNCTNVICGHETFNCDWYGTDRRPLKSFVQQAQVRRMTNLSFGDSGYFYLPHVPYLLEQLPDLKIVHLWRPKGEVVDSFMRWCEGGGRTRPLEKMELVNRGGKWALVAGALPLIDGATAEQAWGFYWEFYKRMVSETIPKSRRFNMKTEDLNDDAALGRLFDYLEIPEQNRRLLEKRRHYGYEEVKGELARSE